MRQVYALLGGTVVLIQVIVALMIIQLRNKTNKGRTR